MKGDSSRCRVPHVYKPVKEADWFSEKVNGCSSLCCGIAVVKVRVNEKNNITAVEKLGDPYCHDGWDHTTSLKNMDYNCWSFQKCRHNQEGQCIAKVVQEPEGRVIFKDEWDALRWEENTARFAGSRLRSSSVAESPVSPGQSTAPEMSMVVASVSWPFDGSSMATTAWRE